MDGRDGLPLLAPSGLTVDAAGLVWLTSVRGLIRVDPADVRCALYGVRDGLPSQEFGDRGRVPRPFDGRILAGSPEGLVLFDPAVVRAGTGRARTWCIETIGARNREGRVDFATDRPFQVAPDDRDLRIVARLLSFNDASNNRYRFLLEGYDRGWVEVGADGERVFSQLKAGQLPRSRVKARTADNVWSQVRVVRFRVASPWWRTWWAIATWVLLAAVVALVAAAQRAQRLKRTHAWQLAKHRQRTRRTGLAGEDPLPRHARPRSAHADDRRAGHERTAARHRPRRAAARLYRSIRRAGAPSVAAGQRRARPGAHRGRPAGTASRRPSTCTPWSTKWRR